MSLSFNPLFHGQLLAPRPVCAICSAIPLEIFRHRNREQTGQMFEDELSHYSFEEEHVGVDVPVAKEDYCYQHYSGSEALMAMSSSSRQGCTLCTILWFSLEASKQLLPRPTFKTPKLPERLPTETGITLHSFDDSHFIVRDNIRWSLVRFSEGNHMNEEGLQPQRQLLLMIEADISLFRFPTA